MSSNLKSQLNNFFMNIVEDEHIEHPKPKTKINWKKLLWRQLIRFCICFVFTLLLSIVYAEYGHDKNWLRAAEWHKAFHEKFPEVFNQ